MDKETLKQMEEKVDKARTTEKLLRVYKSLLEDLEKRDLANITIEVGGDFKDGPVTHWILSKIDDNEILIPLGVSLAKSLNAEIERLQKEFDGM